MATADLERLFVPFCFGSLNLPNRFAMAPMTRNMSPGNLLGEEAPAYYARRARGECGLIITEGAAVPHPVAQADATIPDFCGPGLERWEAVVRAVHAVGSAIFPQLWHAGIYRDQAGSINPGAISMGPSVVGRNPVRAMTERDIADVVAAFADAAVMAQRIGCDGIELHGAHGYLLDQFFWPRTNRRDDSYGGPMENRIRFACETIAAVRAATGPSFPIMFRFSQWKGNIYDARIAENPGELEAWLCPLAEAGVDIFHASTRRFWLAEFEGSELNLAGWARKVTGKPSMTVGSVGLESPNEVGKLGMKPPAKVSLANLDRLVEMQESGDFDLVALGRIVLSNPDWPRLVREGQFDRIRPFDPVACAASLK